MPGKPQPLFSNQAIVDKDGQPTQYFIRWAQQRQIDIAGGITPEQAQALVDTFAADRQIDAGAGLSGGGPLSHDVTLALHAFLSNLLDIDFSVDPADGQFLAFSGSDQKWKAANPPTAPPAGMSSSPALSDPIEQVAAADGAQSVTTPYSHALVFVNGILISKSKFDITSGAVNIYASAGILNGDSIIVYPF